MKVKDRDSVPLGTAPTGTRADFWRDLFASVVVFLVALPLCMGIAIASGAPPTAGIITGIIGGIVAGALAGCPLQVSGPAAGLTVIVFELVTKHGLETMGAVVLLAGVIQVVAGVLRVGQWFRAVPPAVIHGMLAGIGVLIFAGQFHVMVDDTPQASGVKNLITIPLAVWKGLVPLDGSSHHLAAALGVLTILIVIAWSYLAPKRLRLLPAPLIAVTVASVVAAMFKMPVKYVSVPSSFVTSLKPLGPAIVTKLLDTSVVIAAIGMAVIASAETLLTASAVDQMQTGPRTRFNKELLAQGVGNTLSGILGGLPMTGVIVRSSANVTAGAVTRRSTILHGAWLLLLVALLPGLLRKIPVASLAAVLVYTGYKLVNPAHVRALARVGRGQVIIYFITLTAIVTTDLLKGVLFGLVAALFRLILRFSRLAIELQRQPGDADEAGLKLRGAATFLAVPRLAETIEHVPVSTRVTVDGSGLTFIDDACMELLRGWEQRHRAAGGTVTVNWDDLYDRQRRKVV